MRVVETSQITFHSFSPSIYHTVCTLFNNAAESDCSNDIGIVAPPKQDLADVTKNASNPAESPAVCNVFQNTPSSEDLFSEIKTQSCSPIDESRQIHNIPEERDIQPSTSQVTETLDLPVEIAPFSFSDNNNEEDTNNNANMIITEASDMMTSIMIHDEDSFENISNISIDQKDVSDVQSETEFKETSGVSDPITHDHIEAEKQNTTEHEVPKVEKLSQTPTVTPTDPIDTNSVFPVRVEETVDTLKTEAPLASNLFTSTVVTNPFDNLVQGQESIFSGNDAFTHALTSSESDRRKDAWIPTESTQTVLDAVAQSQKRISLEPNHLVRPGLGTSEYLGDPIKAVLARYKGNEFIERNTLSANDVNLDKQGLKELIDTGNLRAAVDLCGKVLTNLGQGFGQKTQESCNTPETLQWWNARLALLVRLKAFELAETEISQFGELDSADLYFGFYPDLYPGRQGSMVPFSMRLLQAEFPKHTNKPAESIARLYAMMDVCNKILDNLTNLKSEIGIDVKLKDEDKQASLELWQGRKIQILYAIGNALIQFHEYQAAFKTFDEISKLQPSDKVALQSGIGRAFLQLGDIKSAQLRFADVEKEVGNDPAHKFQLFTNRGFLYLGANKWDEALQQFGEALKLAPHNLEVLNNKAVCLLYLCRLKDAIATLESAINISSESVSSPKPSTQHQPITFEGALNNLVTLYELESTRSFAKKQMLLQQMALTVGDGFDVTCLKM
uniref:Trafficking protein particle complex subunit 12-like n=1 Tax=Phallusia mammillata TaxID=59560 RepID=A0A6F9DVM3_9ASCI|nr:trafficking protein particle complex subunit 12-like [Phallusia mammillata]